MEASARRHPDSEKASGETTSGSEEGEKQASKRMREQVGRQMKISGETKG